MVLCGTSWCTCSGESHGALGNPMVLWGITWCSRESHGTLGNTSWCTNYMILENYLMLWGTSWLGNLLRLRGISWCSQEFLGALGNPLVFKKTSWCTEGNSLMFCGTIMWSWKFFGALKESSRYTWQLLGILGSLFSKKYLVIVLTRSETRENQYLA